MTRATATRSSEHLAIQIAFRGLESQRGLFPCKAAALGAVLLLAHTGTRLQCLRSSATAAGNRAAASPSELVAQLLYGFRAGTPLTARKRNSRDCRRSGRRASRTRCLEADEFERRPIGIGILRFDGHARPLRTPRCEAQEKRAFTVRKRAKFTSEEPRQVRVVRC